MPAPDSDDSNARPLSGDERMRISFTAADLAARLAELRDRVPAETWRNVAAQQIADAMVSARNGHVPKQKR